MFPIRTVRKAALGVLVLASGFACSTKTKEQKAKVDVTLDPVVAADFKKRVDDYVARAKELADRLPKLSKDANPQQIDTDQRKFEKLLVSERPNAKQGDFFVPGMAAYVKSLMHDVFADTLGKAEHKAVTDNEPHPVRPEINKRYPDEIPLSTMPPRLLANLPLLPDGLEYRIVRADLVLMDVHGHIILDYLPDVMPPVAPEPDDDH